MRTKHLFALRYLGCILLGLVGCSSLFSPLNCSGDCRGADLQGADLEDTDFSRYDFSEANLAQANLRGANLNGAILTQVDLKGQKINSHKFGSINWKAQALQRMHYNLSSDGVLRICDRLPLKPALACSLTGNLI